MLECTTVAHAVSIACKPGWPRTQLTKPTSYWPATLPTTEHSCHTFSVLVNPFLVPTRKGFYLGAPDGRLVRAGWHLGRPAVPSLANVASRRHGHLDSWRPQRFHRHLRALHRLRGGGVVGRRATAAAATAVIWALPAPAVTAAVIVAMIVKRVIALIGGARFAGVRDLGAVWEPRG